MTNTVEEFIPLSMSPTQSLFLMVYSNVDCAITFNGLALFHFVLVLITIWNCSLCLHISLFVCVFTYHLCHPDSLTLEYKSQDNVILFLLLMTVFSGQLLVLHKHWSRKVIKRKWWKLKKDKTSFILRKITAM